MLHNKLQASKPSDSEEEDLFFFFLCIFMVLNLARGYLGNWDIHLNKIGKGPLGNATD